MGASTSFFEVDVFVWFLMFWGVSAYRSLNAQKLARISGYIDVEWVKSIWTVSNAQNQARILRFMDREWAKSAKIVPNPQNQAKI